MAKKKETVMVLCAHSDDQIFGAGGTLAKYAKEGIDIVIVVFSYGEMSHPWLKKHYIAKTRKKESEEAAKIIGAKKTIFFGLTEGKFVKEFEEKNILGKIEELLKKYKPSKIFTHSADDPLPDHKAMNTITLNACNDLNYNGHVYSFDVWNPVKFEERDVPKMYVDITNTFEIKLKALKAFKSQWLTKLWLMWSVYARALKNGLKNNCKFAEVFYKIR